MTKRSRRVIPNAVSELLAANDVKEMLALFRSYDMATATGAVLVSVDKDENVAVLVAGLTVLQTIGALSVATDILQRENDGKRDEGSP
jgi:hypothetical protein